MKALGLPGGIGASAAWCLARGSGLLGGPIDESFPKQTPTMLQTLKAVHDVTLEERVVFGMVSKRPKISDILVDRAWRAFLYVSATS